jgi:hypothetical protein
MTELNEQKKKKHYGDLLGIFDKYKSTGPGAVQAVSCICYAKPAMIIEL